jgi:hypothetical protein
VCGKRKAKGGKGGRRGGRQDALFGANTESGWLYNGSLSHGHELVIRFALL